MEKNNKNEFHFFFRKPKPNLPKTLNPNMVLGTAIHAVLLIAGTLSFADIAMVMKIVGRKPKRKPKPNVMPKPKPLPVNETGEALPLSSADRYCC